MAISADSDAYQITWLIRRLFRTMGQIANARLEEMGISAADRAVMEFLYPDSAMSVPEIAAKYNVSRQHIQVTVNALLEKKLIVSKKNPRHKRSSLMALSKKGRNMFSQILMSDLEAIEDWFSGTPREELKQTRRTLSLLLENLRTGVNDEIRDN